MIVDGTLIVGVDCAVDPRKVGVATGIFASGVMHLRKIGVCSTDSQPADSVTAAIRGQRSALLAVDAPLGWPQAFGAQLARHQAGEVLESNPNDFVRRQTDKFVKARVGQQPLDVGADRIARTALAALGLLASVREKIGGLVELAWDPEAVRGVKVIEVYPAATLRAHGLPSRGYKRPEDQEDRSAIVEALRARMVVECPDHLLIANADALDAVVCLLAAGDFLRGESLAPTDGTVAKKEGWIWVRDPDIDTSV